MKVFILRGIYNYEGSQILGVYYTLEIAKEQKLKHSNLPYNDYNEYEIVEEEVLG